METQPLSHLCDLFVATKFGLSLQRVKLYLWKFLVKKGKESTTAFFMCFEKLDGKFFHEVACCERISVSVLKDVIYIETANKLNGFPPR